MRHPVILFSNIFFIYLHKKVEVDISISYSWQDDRLNFTGDGELNVPSYLMKKSKCKEEITIPFFEKIKNFMPISGSRQKPQSTKSNVTHCLTWNYERHPSPIWIPKFKYADPTEEKSATLEKFTAIRNVRNFVHFHHST